MKDAPYRPWDPDFSPRVERRLASILAALPEDGAPPATAVLDDAVRHLVIAPGAKRARPLLAHVFGVVVGLDDATAVDLAAAAELIHSASLLHDDVVDHGTRRRGQPTANVVYGDVAAVLAGDLALSTAICTLAPYPRVVADGAVSTVVEMARGSLHELRHRRVMGELATWRQIAVRKTGALFAWCGEAAALTAGDSAAAARFAAFGRDLGVGFQLADDLKDFGFHGKDHLADLANGNPSYPIWLAAQRDPALHDALTDLWRDPTRPTEARLSALAAAVARTGALDATAGEAEAAFARALHHLGPLAAEPALQPLHAFVSRLAVSMMPAGPATADHTRETNAA